MSSSIRAVDPPISGSSVIGGVRLDWSTAQLVARRPVRAALELLALSRGALYTAVAKLVRPRVKIGRRLRIYGRLRIKGPGSVVFGDDVAIYGKVTPHTNRAGAVIEIGDRTKLDGTRFSCVQSVRIGKDCLLANCRILDSAFHSIQRAGEGAPIPILEAPIDVGDNVWISLDAGLLPGTRIGENSVIAMGAICKGEFPSSVLILGNPARVAGRIP